MTTRALITGGAGFIGVWIADRLMRHGVAVRVFDVQTERATARILLGEAADALEWVAGDVADADAVRGAAKGCDLIVHLAALLTPDCKARPLRGAQVNLVGTLNAFEAARALGIRKVLYMSSAGVYGPDDGMHPRPTTLYGAWKLAGEGIARAYFHDYGIASAGFRPLVVYGPGRETGLTAGPTLACRAAARGDDYTIPFGGESDFVFVDDVAAAFEAAATSPLSGAEVYNVTGEIASVDQVAETVMAAAPGARIGADGPPVPVCAHIEGGEVRSVFPSVPRTPLVDGIARTIAHYRG